MLPMRQSRQRICLGKQRNLFRAPTETPKSEQFGSHTFSFFLFGMCLCAWWACVCVHTCCGAVLLERGWLHVHMCVCVHGEVQGWHQESCLTALHIIWWGKISQLSPEFAILASLPFWRALGNPLSLPPRVRIAGRPCPLAFSRFGGIQSLVLVLGCQTLHPLSHLPNP